jgi:hypothetical protein
MEVLELMEFGQEQANQLGELSHYLHTITLTLLMVRLFTLANTLTQQV